MNRYLIILIANILLSLFQTSFLNELFGTYLNFNLILAFSFSFLLLDEDELSVFSAFTGGLMLDMLSLGFVGSYAMFLTISLYISYLVKRYIFKSFVFQLILVFIFSVLYKSFMFYLNGGGIVVINIYLLISHLGTTFFASVFYLLNSYIKERFLKHEYRLNK